LKPWIPGSQQRRRSLLIEAVAVVAIALLLIFFMPAEFSPQFTRAILALAIVALGIDLIWGYTGLLSLGHGIFFGLGGYAIANLKLQVPPA